MKIYAKEAPRTISILVLSIFIINFSKNQVKQDFWYRNDVIWSHDHEISLLRCTFASGEKWQDRWVFDRCLKDRLCLVLEGNTL